MVKNILIEDIFSTRIGHIVDYLVTALGKANLQNISNFWTFALVIFGVFQLLLFLLYIFIWKSYVRNLMLKIWRTQGMVNMIPFEIIKENKKLMEAIEKGNYL